MMSKTKIVAAGVMEVALTAAGTALVIWHFSGYDPEDSRLIRRVEEAAAKGTPEEVESRVGQPARLSTLRSRD